MRLDQTFIQEEVVKLLFFLMLFGVAGTLQYTEVTSEIAASLKHQIGGEASLVPIVMLLSALGSAFVDNVIFVAAFIPVVQELIGDAPAVHPLWWALLFGACFGGNITMIGSTANIVALGMMEKRYRSRIDFLEWFRVGLAAAFVACLIAWLALLVTGPMMIGDAG